MTPQTDRVLEAIDEIERLNKVIDLYKNAIDMLLKCDTVSGEIKACLTAVKYSVEDIND